MRLRALLRRCRRWSWALTMVIASACSIFGTNSSGCGSCNGTSHTSPPDLARTGNPCFAPSDCAPGNNCIVNRCCPQAVTCGVNCCNNEFPCCVVTISDGGVVDSRCAANNCGDTCCASGACCNGQCCDVGSVCVSGACMRKCNFGSECAAGECCILQQDGSRLCQASADACPCTTHNDCPQGGCCVFPDGGVADGGTADGGAGSGSGGTCGSQSASCGCTSGADCTSGCCAPATNAAGDPVGPYVCKPGQGGAYDCCLNGHVCNDPYCCLQDGHGNDFCAKTCNNNGDCGASQCVTYLTIPFTTTCNGFGLGLSQTGCGP